MFLQETGADPVKLEIEDTGFADRGWVRAVILAGLVSLAGCGATAVAPIDADPEQRQRVDLNGLWQAVGTAHWNLEGGHAIKGPATIVLGALGGIPAGQSYLVDGPIPYKKEAAEKRAEYRAAWNEWDPVVKCFIQLLAAATCVLLFRTVAPGRTDPNISARIYKVCHS